MVGFPHHGTTAEALIHAADIGLYAAKKGGRDQIATAPLDETKVKGASQ